MKLPISLLILAALGEAVKLTTEKSKTSTHTSKRELREGIFGQRTELLKKYVHRETTPGAEYLSDHFKPTLQGPSSTEQIFGSRLPPISKISDLLSRPSPSFELALANHLYSPVSAYAVKLPSFEEKVKPATKSIFSKHKSFKHLKHLQEESYEAQKHPTKDSFQSPELFSYINADFRPGPGSPPYPFGPALSGLNPAFAATPHPQKDPGPLFQQQIPFGFRLKTPGHSGSLQYYNPQSPGPHPTADFDFEYENQKDREHKHSKGEKQYETYNPASRHEQERQQAGPVEVYSSHPRGAISYSSFTNQAFLAAHPESQMVFKYSKLQEPQIASDLRQQQQFYVPQLYQSENGKLPAPVTQQQYYTPQAQTYYDPRQQTILLYPVDQSGKAPSPQFVPVQQPQLYLNPNRQQLLQDLQQGAALQSLNLQQPPVIYKPVPIAVHPEPVGSSSTLAPPAYQTVPTYQQLPEHSKIRYADQPAAQNSIDASAVSVFAPTPVAPDSTASSLSVQPLQPHPNDAVQQVAITPKSHLAHDQVVKPTTAQPQTVRDPSQSPSHLYQDSNVLQEAQPTIQAQHSSPAMIHLNHPEQYSSTSPQPEVLIGAHQSHPQEVQQLNLGEHSHLAAGAVDPSQQAHGVQNSQPTEATPPQYQITTPQPTSPSTTDYEIEIASHVDHSQLPKDLRPVTSQHQDQKAPAFQAPRIPDEALPPPVQNQFDSNGHYLRPFPGPVQPLIQPRVYPGAQTYVVPAGEPQPQVALYSPQYFERYPGSAY